MDARFRPRDFAEIEGWNEGGHAAALDAFRRTAPRLAEGSLPTGSLGIEAGAFAEAARAALSDPGDPRAFFERWFRPLEILPESGEGFLTGYYEPVMEGSLIRTERFTVPLYAPPPDLAKVDDVSRPPGFDPYFRFARRRPDGFLEEYPDRAAIARGLLGGQRLEIAWLESEVEAFFIHIQGSARLVLPDGSSVRVGYAAKTGHRFTAIGRILVEEGELSLGEADMAGIRRWLAAHPQRVRALLDRNRSFIFFARHGVEDETLGPLGAAKVPLTPLASVAMDREHHTYGVPVFVGAPSLSVEGAPYRRLAVAQDTGSAILGAARADLFVGSGDAAGAIAGAVRHPARFTLLAPPALAERLLT